MLHLMTLRRKLALRSLRQPRLERRQKMHSLKETQFSRKSEGIFSNARNPEIEFSSGSWSFRARKKFTCLHIQFN